MNVMAQLSQQEARGKVRALKATLQRLMERDPDQEVQGIALPVVDEVLAVGRTALPDQCLVAHLEDLITPELIESAEPVRAADALIVVDQLFEAFRSAQRVAR
jgi:hypothetical protein